MRRITLLTNPDVCNLRCPLCFLNQRKRAFGMGEMKIETARRAIDRYAGMGPLSPDGLREVIPSTMGEPLLYTYFSELLDYCRARHLPLNLTTNGTFPGFWGTDAGMARLLDACSDIKVSCMAFDGAAFDEMMPGFSFDRWRENVLRLLHLWRQGKGTVSLQVTLSKMLASKAVEILSWAESVGIKRIKWNLPVFLSMDSTLRKAYGLDLSAVRELREILVSKKVRCEGSLFFDGGEKCRFLGEEVWVLPDGTEETCPNPERRFGDRNSAGAKCEGCLLLHPFA